MRTRHLPVHLRLVARALPYRSVLIFTWLSVLGSSLMVVAAPRLVGWAIDFGLDIEDEIALGSMRTLLIAVTLATGLLVAWRAYVEPYRRRCSLAWLRRWKLDCLSSRLREPLQHAQSLLCSLDAAELVGQRLCAKQGIE